MSSRREVTVRVNGKSYSREIDVRTTLADFLRHELELTGTHIGCEHGVCGACTILLDGRSARSCLLLAVQTDGKEISTIEGLAGPDGELNDLQQAFIENHGLQCGFCTPGVLMTATELLADDPDPSEEKIRDIFTGNLCRCTGYSGMVAAVLQVARNNRQAGS